VCPNNTKQLQQSDSKPQYFPSRPFFKKKKTDHRKPHKAIINEKAAIA